MEQGGGGVAMFPDVSVIVPVYNGEETLCAAVESLVVQSLGNAEFIVIDDGSKDGSAALIASFSDPRIRRFRQSNQGLAATLNRGIALARGRYVARLDQDDCSFPDRLARQVGYMEAHPDVALLGTWAQIYVGDQRTHRFHRHPASSAALKLELLVDNPFVHSSIMMRADIAKSLGGYKVERSTVSPEDYEFWSRIAARHEVANLPEVLLAYHEHPGSISRASSSEIAANVVTISARNLRSALGPKVGEEECLGLACLYHGLSADRTGQGGIEAVTLWRDAAAAVGGPPVGWSSEFRASYARIRRRLWSRLVRRALPDRVLELTRQSKRLLRGEI